MSSVHGWRGSATAARTLDGIAQPGERGEARPLARSLALAARAKVRATRSPARRSLGPPACLASGKHSEAVPLACWTQYGTALVEPALPGSLASRLAPVPTVIPTLVDADEPCRRSSCCRCVARSAHPVHVARAARSDALAADAARRSRPLALPPRRHPRRDPSALPRACTLVHTRPEQRARRVARSATRNVDRERVPPARL